MAASDCALDFDAIDLGRIGTLPRIQPCRATMCAPISVHGAGCSLLRRISSSHISWKASPRSGISTAGNCLEQLKASSCYTAIRVREQVGGDHGRRRHRPLTQDPCLRRNPQDNIWVIGRFRRLQLLLDLSESFGAHIPIHGVVHRHDVKPGNLCRETTLYEAVVLEFGQITRQNTPSVDSGSSLARFQRPPKPLPVEQPPLEPRS